MLGDHVSVHRTTSRCVVMLFKVKARDFLESSLINNRYIDNIATVSIPYAS